VIMMSRSVESKQEKTPAVTPAEVREKLKLYLNTSFNYKNLQNHKERQIFESGFWAGSRFIQDFTQERNAAINGVDVNAH